MPAWTMRGAKVSTSPVQMCNDYMYMYVYMNYAARDAIIVRQNNNYENAVHYMYMYM